MPGTGGRSSRRSVLVGYDGSEPARRALEHAADFVGRGGRVAVIDVIKEQSISSRLETLSDEQRSAQDNRLREARTVLADRGIEAHLIRAAGDPATEILTAAAETGADVIVLGRHRGGAAHLLHGSLSSALVRRATCDVLVVH